MNDQAESLWNSRLRSSLPPDRLCELWSQMEYTREGVQGERLDAGLTGM